MNAKESFRKLNNEIFLVSLRNKAIIESVKGSNAIEGIITSDSRIKEIINGSLSISHDEKEISGYKDALNLIHNEYDHIDIEKDTILQFHQMFEKQTNPNDAGKYKKVNNYITELDENAHRKTQKSLASGMNANKIILDFRYTF